MWTGSESGAGMGSVPVSPGVFCAMWSLRAFSVEPTGPLLRILSIEKLMGKAIVSGLPPRYWGHLVKEWCARKGQERLEESHAPCRPVEQK